MSSKEKTEAETDVVVSEEGETFVHDFDKNFTQFVILQLKPRIDASFTKGYCKLLDPEAIKLMDKKCKTDKRFRRFDPDRDLSERTLLEIDRNKLAILKSSVEAQGGQIQSDGTAKFPKGLLELPPAESVGTKGRPESLKNPDAAAVATDAPVDTTPASEDKEPEPMEPPPPEEPEPSGKNKKRGPGRPPKK